MRLEKCVPHLCTVEVFYLHYRQVFVKDWGFPVWPRQFVSLTALAVVLHSSDRLIGPGVDRRKSFDVTQGKFRFTLITVLTVFQLWLTSTKLEPERIRPCVRVQMSKVFHALSHCAIIPNILWRI